MRRIHIFAGLAACALLLFASMSATVAAPVRAPMLQTNESEPNDSTAQADPVDVGTSITGQLEMFTDVDYFSLTTDIDREYEASLTIWNNEGEMLRMSLYNPDGDYIKGSSSTASSTKLPWMAHHDSAFISIEVASVPTHTVFVDYRLTIKRVAVTPTTPPEADAYEEHDGYGNNNSWEVAYVFSVATSASASNANFVPSLTDEDWFSFYVKKGRRYRVSTSDLRGVDTYLRVYWDYDAGSAAENNDGGGGFASKVEWQAVETGWYYIQVTNRVNTSTSSDTYDLTIEEVSVAATSTPRPAPINPDADRCDRRELGNHDFDNACVISADVSEKFNFVPPPFGGSDNDFFKIWVKPTLHFECRTSNLSAGVDPNMILYDHNRNPIGGNDDVAPGDFNSQLAYYSMYEGWLYVLVGYGDRTPPDLSNSNYTLVCNMQVPGQATATKTPESAATPTSTPQTTATAGAQPATPTSTSVPVATPTREPLTVRPLTTPTPVPVTTPSPRFVPIRLLIYYDGNADGQPGAGEGIGTISAQAYEIATNRLLAQGFTDERGNLEFTVATHGPVRVNVPFFGFTQLVAGEGASIYLRIPPQPLSEGMP